MPYLGLSGTLFLEKFKIMDFLESYSQIYTDYQINEHEKIKQFFWYYELFIGKYIDTFISSFRIS